MSTINSYKIKSKKQDNGLFGMPLQCTAIDRLPGKENEVIHSALCIAIAETHPNETFEICLSNEFGFIIQFNDGGMKRLKYSDYELTDDVLTWKAIH